MLNVLILGSPSFVSTLNELKGFLKFNPILEKSNNNINIILFHIDALKDKKQKEFIEKKKLSQPSQIKTCGSTFKNFSKEKKAWQLIKEAGCDEFSEGDAVISKKHCNFFVNNGKANSSDIEKLIYKVKKKINDKTGINLELEIKIVGE